MSMESYTRATFFGCADWLILGNELTLDEIPEKFPVDGDPCLFDPASLAFRKPLMPRTSRCWRGFEYAVRIDAEGLFLDWLALEHDPGIPYPIINGKAPMLVKDVFEARYEGVGLALQYTGVIRLGRDFITDLRGPMYLLPPYLFCMVIDVELSAGAFVTARNRSMHFKEYRARFGESIQSKLAERDQYLGLAP